MDESPDVSEGGIVLPEAARPRSPRGTVVAVGPGRLNDHGLRLPMDFQEGDRIFVADFTGQAIEHEGQEYIVLHQGEVLATVIS